MSKRKLGEVKDFLNRLDTKANAFEVSMRDEGLYVLDLEGKFGHGWYACYTEHMEEIKDPWDVPRNCLHPKEAIQSIPNSSYTQCKKCGKVFGVPDSVKVKDLKTFLDKFSEDQTIHFMNEKLSVQENTESGVKFTYFDDHRGEINPRGLQGTTINEGNE